MNEETREEGKVELEAESGDLRDKDSWVVSDVRKAVKNFELDQIVKWKEHVIGNRYRGGKEGGDLSEKIIAVLQEEIDRRRK